MPEAHIIRDFPFDIDERSVLRHQGYRKSSKVSDRVRELLDDAMKSAKTLARPQGIWLVDRIASSTEDSVKLSRGMEIRSKLLARVLRGCTEAVMFAVTVGPDVEAESARLMDEGEAAEAVMLDSAGGEAAEGCANYLNTLVQRDAHRRGLHLTPRFSPGYGDWQLENQRELFEALSPGKINITLTESCVMIPRKSISAVLGLGPLDKIRTGTSPCKQCAMGSKAADKK